MTTSIEPLPARDVIRAGDDIGAKWASVIRAYLPLREPNERIRVLQSWRCSGCDALQWAVVVIAAKCVESISAVLLDAAAIAAAHAIDDRIAVKYVELTGDPLFVGGRARPGFGERLQEALARQPIVPDLAGSSGS